MIFVLFFFLEKYGSGFFSKKQINEKIGSPISIPNFPKIPKIILRKLWDEARHTSSAISKKNTISPQNGPNQGFLVVAISQTVSFDSQNI